MLAGILLSQFGIQNVVLEEAAGPSSHPKAHSISNRTMEIFRTLFLPRLPTKPSLSQSSNTCSRPLRTVEQAVQESVPPMREWRAFRYVDQLVNGQLYGMVDHFPGALRFQH
jgi:2-polyprenyl-6-methoxyphenol hydroxylase-like FAD-dependent oxidoreductase